MSRFDDMYNFDWLPGFKEIMACQENRMEQTMEDQEPEEREMPEMPEMSLSRNRVENGNQMDSMPDAPLPPEQLQQEEQMYWNDYEYIIRMLPAVAREIWVVADAVLDRYEFEGSSIYAEYPDKVSIQKIVDLIYDKLKYYENNRMENRVDGSERRNGYYMSPEDRGAETPLRNLIFTIVGWNIAYRRQRYRRRRKVFPLS